MEAQANFDQRREALAVASRAYPQRYARRARSPLIEVQLAYIDKWLRKVSDVVFFVRSVYVLLCLLLAACQQKGWIYNEVRSDCPQFNSALLRHPPSNTFNGIEVHFLKGEFGTFAFLNVFARQFSTGLVDIEKEGEHYLFESHVFGGAQRLQLPNSATEFIIDSLLSGKHLVIRIDDYYTEILPENFSQKYTLLFQSIGLIKTGR